jgi:two-component system response regulator YesN
MDRKEISDIIKGIIQVNFRDPNFCVGKLSTDLKTCESHLRDIFSKHFRMSPQHLIETIRLEKALEHLSSGRSISEAMHGCGYSELRSFRNAFKKRLQMSPSEFRELTKIDCEQKAKILNHCLYQLWVK